jgi:hypothetical protein
MGKYGRATHFAYFACEWLVIFFFSEVYVVAHHCKSTTGRVHRMVTPLEITTASNLLVGEQHQLPNTLYEIFLPTLRGRPPIGVVRILSDDLTPGFCVFLDMGGGSSSEV